MADFVVRKAELKDAELLTEMRLEMRRERDTGCLEIPEEEFYQQTLAFFENGIRTGSFISYIAWDGNSAAACSGLTIHIHPPTYANPTGKHGYITNMYTRPAWRKMGLARTLVDAVVAAAEAEGCNGVFLNASPMGKPLYVKYGFQDVEGEMFYPLSRKN
ncbi:MAG: GNAT family N-acetyltransferase [Lentisphaeria bacterium]|nr:GNAT family N-acetyltransferase [Lentisphaeria bacterium]